jgi:hypothetical protein
MLKFPKREPEVKRRVSLNDSTLNIEFNEKIQSIKLSELSKFTFVSGESFLADTYILESGGIEYMISSEDEGSDDVWQYFINLEETDYEAATNAIRESVSASYVIWEATS